MSKENYFHKIKELPETTKQFGGLVVMIIIVILSFAVLNNIFGEGDELVAKMKAEEITTDELNEQMNEFLEGLRAEADNNAPTMPYPRGSMVPAFGDVGFALEVGQVGMADYHEENSPFGWHIIRRVD